MQRDRSIFGIGVAVTGIALAAESSQGQAFDLVHQWTRAAGGSAASVEDFGRGIGVLSDGTTAIAAEFRANLVGPFAPGPPPPSKTFVAFIPSDNAGPPSLWVREFKDGPASGTGTCSPTGVAVPGDFSGFGRRAYVCGWMTGDIDFGLPFGISTSPSVDRRSFVALVNRDAMATDHVWRFDGLGSNQATCIAPGPYCGGGNPPCTSGQPGDGRVVLCPMLKEVMAVGGFSSEVSYTCFNPLGQIPHCEISAGGDDAFVCILDMRRGIPEYTGYVSHLYLASSSSERVTGVAIDPVDQAVVITGFYSSEDLNLNHPLGVPLTPGDAHYAGADAFVARYRWVEIGFPHLELDWVYFTGTLGDDSGASVAIDAAGDVYATGWLRGDDGSRDLWVAKIQPPSEPPPSPYIVEEAVWEYVYAGNGDDIGNSITLDGLDRVLVAGHFGIERLVGSPPQTYSLDFDPSTGVDSKSTAGGLDAFIVRFDPDGIYDGVLTVGAAYNESTTAIANDPVDTTRVGYTGYFGAPNAPAGYTVDFNPGPGVANKATNGRADVFVSSFLPWMPEEPKAQVSLVIPASLSVDEDDYATMVAAYAGALADPDVVPQDSSAVVDAVMFGLDYACYGAIKVMPWTLFNERTGPLFARRLALLARYPTSAITSIEQGALTSAGSFEHSGVDPCFATISITSDQANLNQPLGSGTLMDSTRDLVIAFPFIHQLTGYGVTPGSGLAPMDRAYMLDEVAAGDSAGLGFALGTTPPDDGFDDPLFGALMARRISREARCAGDFDRDGDVDALDVAAFSTAFSMGHPDADWDFDGVVAGPDSAAFMASHALGCCPE